MITRHKTIDFVSLEYPEVLWNEAIITKSQEKVSKLGCKSHLNRSKEHDVHFFKGVNMVHESDSNPSWSTIFVCPG